MTLEKLRLAQEKAVCVLEDVKHEQEVEKLRLEVQKESERKKELFLKYGGLFETFPERMMAAAKKGENYFRIELERGDFSHTQHSNSPIVVIFGSISSDPTLTVGSPSFELIHAINEVGFGVKVHREKTIVASVGYSSVEYEYQFWAEVFFDYGRD